MAYTDKRKKTCKIFKTNLHRANQEIHEKQHVMTKWFQRHQKKVIGVDNCSILRNICADTGPSQQSTESISAISEGLKPTKKTWYSWNKSVEESRVK